MSTTVINQEVFITRLKAEMAAEMQKAAEPIIQQAMRDAEVAIRTRVGAMCIGLIDQHMDIQRSGTSLRITLQQMGGTQ